jgi:parvulin-like peptidyl-prolyl isomerase
MKPVFVVLALLGLVAVAAPTTAQSRDEALLGDLQRLQEDLANLDGELPALEPEDLKTDEFRKRAEQIREETIYLKVKMQRHQRDGGSGTGVTHDELAQLRRSIGNLRNDMDRAFGREEGDLSSGARKEPSPGSSSVAGGPSSAPRERTWSCRRAPC